MSDTERLTTLALAAAESLLKPLGFDYTLLTEPYEDSIVLHITSSDASHLIGDEGDRLDDLQYLINRLVQAEWENAPRVRVDCDRYRERAEEKLLRRARARARVADGQAAADGKAQRLSAPSGAQCPRTDARHHHHVRGDGFALQAHHHRSRGSARGNTGGSVILL